jgi:hypothetical protein
MRLIIASIVAGIAMFAWGAVSHIVLGIGEATPMPNEGPIMAAMKTGMPDAGLYFAPGMDMRQANDEQKAAWAEKYKEGPTAMVIYHPTGEDPTSPKMFAVELGSDIAAALVVAMILSLAGAGFSRGVTISVLVGLAGWLSISVSYWDWYRFPTNFTTSELIDQIGGWLCAGFVLGFMSKRRL